MVLAALAVLCAGPARAQQPSNEDLRKQLEAITEAIKALQKDVQDIKAALVRPPTAPSGINVVLDLADNAAKGRLDAPLTLVEFTDYQ
jgi:protein-disulfide isomerase